MLIVEVLSENEEPEKVGNGDAAREEEPHDLDAALMEDRTESHAAAGPGKPWPLLHTGVHHSFVSCRCSTLVQLTPQSKTKLLRHQDVHDTQSGLLYPASENVFDCLLLIRIYLSL